MKDYHWINENSVLRTRINVNNMESKSVVNVGVISLSNGEDTFVNPKGILCTAHVRSAVVCGSEAWLIDNVRRLEWAEKKVVVQ